MENNIKTKLIKGTVWNIVEKITVKGASFVISIILARLLTPEDYGIIGMLLFFIMLSNIFIESGFVKALIQKQDRNEVDFSTVFYFNLLISVFLYFVLYFSAPYISSFYKEETLTDLLRILSLNIIIGSINVVQRAKLMIEMDFKSLAKINFIGTIFGGAIGICMAYCSMGVWSLVGQYICSTLVMTITFFKYTRWFPHLYFSMNSFRTLFRFGSKLLIAGSLATIFNNISTVIIGKVYKSGQLGLYTRANQFTEIIAWTVNDVLGNVTFPVLSQLQNDKKKFIDVYSKSLFYTALIIFPIMILLAIVAKPLVIILLTEKWIECVPLLQILCFARMLTPLSAINMNVLNALGRSDLYMKVDLIKIPIDIALLIIAIPFGVKAIVISSLISTIISFFINTYYPGKLIGYGAIDQIRDYKKIYISLIGMSVVTCLIQLIASNIYIQLFIGLIAGLFSYISFCYMLKIISKESLRSIKILK